MSALRSGLVALGCRTTAIDLCSRAINFPDRAHDGRHRFVRDPGHGRGFGIRTPLPVLALASGCGFVRGFGIRIGLGADIDPAPLSASALVACFGIRTPPPVSFLLSAEASAPFLTPHPVSHSTPPSLSASHSAPASASALAACFGIRTPPPVSVLFPAEAPVSHPTPAPASPSASPSPRPRLRHRPHPRPRSRPRLRFRLDPGSAFASTPAPPSTPSPASIPTPAPPLASASASASILTPPPGSISIPAPPSALAFSPRASPDIVFGAEYLAS